MLIDSHCHLDFDVLSEDIEGVLARMHEAGVGRCVTISTRVAQFDRISAIVDTHEEVWCSVGTHPHHADEEMEVTAQQLIDLAAHPKCVAIGEAGLDYHYDNSDRANQAQSFRVHIDAARQTGLPLVIHARAADDDMADILEKETGKGAFPFILHCFSSGKELAQRGLALGGYISFSGILTFNNAKEIQQVAIEAPQDRILVETDAPYLSPVPHRGKPNQPAYVSHTAAKLAELRGISTDEVADITTANFARLFTKAKLT